MSFDMESSEDDDIVASNNTTTASATATAAKHHYRRSSSDTYLTDAERNLLSTKNPPIFRFVFTGGPCGGKTTSLARVFSYLRERGFQVINCPEAYTILAANGMSVDFFQTDGMPMVIQTTVMNVQMAFEDGIFQVLKARGQPGVMLCDRGLMDGKVYMSDEEFDALLQKQGTDVVQCRDNRYDAVFHLVTAADGAESHYTLENNKVRTETPEEARQLDQRTQQAWLGHPHLYCIDNSTDFEGKMSRLVDTLSKIVGLPSNLKRRSVKFLLKSVPELSNFPPDIHYQAFEVEKIYLQQAALGMDSSSHGDIDPRTGMAKVRDNYSFIRRRTNIDKNGRRLGSVYQLTRAQWAGSELIENKRIISEREYVASALARDEGRHVVQQKRIFFLYDQQSFGIHMYIAPAAGLCILHAQVEASGDDRDKPDVNLPPFLDVDRRILNTKEDKEKYGAYNLSIIR